MMKYLALILSLAPSVAAFSGTRVSRSCSGRTACQTSVASTGSISRSRDHKTRLHYRSGTLGGAKSQPDDFLTSAQTKRGSVWWESIFIRGNDPATAPDQQQVVDDYLEFLDRRWHRLNDKDVEKEPRFSVLEWLSQGSSGDVVPSTPQQEENALHVLGVAGLASQRLLKKHQRAGAFLLKQKAKLAFTNVPVDAEVVEKSEAVVIAVPQNLKPAVSLLRNVQARRNLVVRNQMKSFRRALGYTIGKMMVSPTTAAGKFFALGGGKQTVAVTFTAILALSVVLRPLLNVIVNESLRS